MAVSGIDCRMFFLLITYVGLIKHNYFKIKVHIREHTSTRIVFSTKEVEKEQA